MIDELEAASMAREFAYGLKQKGPTGSRESPWAGLEEEKSGTGAGTFSLAGKVAVVTGATGVLGSEMACSLARSGARVAVLGRREEKANRVAGEEREMAVGKH